MPQLVLIPIRPDGSIEGGPRNLPAIARVVARTTIATPGYAERPLPWVSYLAFDGNACVGSCGFKDVPREAAVELSYFAFPDSEGRGVATAMARELVRVVRGENGGLAIIARTQPAPGASTRVLQKLGFALIGTVVDAKDGEVWDWRLPPDASARP